MTTSSQSGTRTTHEAPAHVAEWYKGDGWYAMGRVPGPGGRGYITRIVGPMVEAIDAARLGRERRLGRQRLFLVRDGRRVV